MKKKDKQLNTRVTNEELEFLDAYCFINKTDKSKVIRGYIQSLMNNPANSAVYDILRKRQSQ